MGIEKDFDELAKDVQEYLKRSADDAKMTIAEEVSLMIGNAIASAVLSVMLFTAFLLLLAAAMLFLSRFTGIIPAFLIGAAAVAAIAGILYYMRERIFTDAIVRHMCRLFMLRRKGNEREEK